MITDIEKNMIRDIDATNAIIKEAGISITRTTNFGDPEIVSLFRFERHTKLLKHHMIKGNVYANFVLLILYHEDTILGMRKWVEDHPSVYYVPYFSWDETIKEFTQ